MHNKYVWGRDESQSAWTLDLWRYGKKMPISHAHGLKNYFLLIFRWANLDSWLWKKGLGIEWNSVGRLLPHFSFFISIQLKLIKKATTINFSNFQRKDVFKRVSFFKLISKFSSHVSGFILGTSFKSKLIQWSLFITFNWILKLKKALIYNALPLKLAEKFRSLTSTTKRIRFIYKQHLWNACRQKPPTFADFHCNSCHNCHGVWNS